SPRKLNTIALTKSNLNVPKPAVTNVRPAQPAPLREPKPEPAPAAAAAPAPVQARKPVEGGGLFGWIKRVLGGDAAKTTPAPRSRDDAQRDGRREERGN